VAGRVVAVVLALEDVETDGLAAGRPLRLFGAGDPKDRGENGRMGRWGGMGRGQPALRSFRCQSYIAVFFLSKNDFHHIFETSLVRGSQVDLMPDMLMMREVLQVSVMWRIVPSWRRPLRDFAHPTFNSLDDESQ
jgi:hypothetical protein